MGFIIFWIIMLLLVFPYFRNILNQPKSNGKKISIKYVFGVPGSGKTTLLTYLARNVERENIKRIKKGKQPLKIYSNVDLMDINYIKIDKSDIGVYDISDGVMLFDESSVDFNNRNTKNMTQEQIKFFKYHRHFNLDIWIFSQSYEDTDITLRRLATEYFKIRKSFFYFIDKRICLERIKKIIFIEKEKKQIIEGYEKTFLSKFTFNAKKYFKYFNSYQRYPLKPFEEKNKKGKPLV